MYKKALGVVVVLLLASNVVLAEGAHKYIGAKKCSMCHKSEDKGNQYGQWQSTKHAHAYETLATPEAKETAEKAGVSGDPQQAPECLKCHVTAYGVDESLLEAGFKVEDGVQCETCHGPGGDYWKMSVMKDKAQAEAAGLIMPSEQVCVKCHSEESPNFSGFSYDDYYPEIAHPRTKE